MSEPRRVEKALREQGPQFGGPQTCYEEQWLRQAEDKSSQLPGNASPLSWMKFTGLLCRRFFLFPKED